MLLVKYACGCVGFPPHELFPDNYKSTSPGTRHGKVYIIQGCNGESRYFCVEREVALEQGQPGSLHKTSRTLSLDECREIFDNLNLLLADGERFRQLRSILNIS